MKSCVQIQSSLARIGLVGLVFMTIMACNTGEYYFSSEGEPQDGVVVDGERISGLKMMRPEVLADTLENAFGERYGTDGTDQIMESNYKLYLGGLDYEGIIDRQTDLSPTNALVVRRLASEYCTQLIPGGQPSTFLGTAGIGPGADVDTVISNLYRMVRSRPISSETATTMRTIYDDLEITGNPMDPQTDAWRAVCIFLFLSEGGISMY